MELSPDVRTSRITRLTSSNESTNFSLISKSLTVSQSQGKALQRYFYRRESAGNEKVQPLPLKKIKLEKIGSFHDQSCISKSAKNTLITNGNQESRDTEFVGQIPNFRECREEECKAEKEVEDPAEDRLTKMFRRTSDWTTAFPYKNSSLLHPKGRRNESSEIKLTLNHRSTKEKPSYSRSNARTNMELVLKKHKADNVRQIQQKMRSVMSRCGNYDSEKMGSVREYNRKCGFGEDSRVFIWNSEDQYIRRILLSWGWIQNPSPQSPFFHLKWTYTPHFPQPSQIRQKQLLNHFKNSHQITTKSYLTKNLKQNEASYGRIDRYYPKCFDVGNQGEWMVFVQEFRRNVMLGLLKRLYGVFWEKRQKEMRDYEMFYGYHFRRDPYGAGLGGRKFKSVFRSKGFRQIQMEDYRQRSPDFLIHANLAVEVVRYWRHFRKQKEQYEDNSYHFLNFNMTKFLDIFNDLAKYASFKDLSTPRSQANFTKEMYSTPSALLLERVSKEYNFCKYTENLFPSYGTHNVWIVKPTSNSRGSGIYLTTDLNQIQSSTKGIQSRLVQKYIQRPLLIKNKKWSAIANKKFDIRQWVLLKSIDPLEVYIFSQCYLRLCYDRYNIDQINELYRHLTNYSINKLKFKNKQESVLPLSYLKELLLQEYGIDWDKRIRPLIQEIVVKSVRSCVESFEDAGANCFEMYGYDILIDQEFRPWLLEINMSPACEERTPWLTDYLNDMGTGLLKLVLPPELLPQTIEEGKYKWELILKQETALNRKKDAELGLEVVGTSVKLNFERDVDIHLIQDKMAFKIQRFFKEYLPNYKRYKIKKACKEKTICLYLNAFKTVIEHRAKEKRLNIVKIKTYLSSLGPQGQFIKLSTTQRVEILSRYLPQLLDERKYKQRLSKYQSQVMTSLARTIATGRQLKAFCGQILKTDKQIRVIQEHIAAYLNFRKQKRRNLQKYFKTIVQFHKFQQKQAHQLHESTIKSIENYLKPLSLWKKTEKQITQAKKELICKYIANLLPRQQFYRRRIEIFLSLVGRVVRVTRRRTRCEHFKIILGSWRDEIEREKQRAIEVENSRLRKIMEAAKLGEESAKSTKYGTIRSNKKP